MKINNFGAFKFSNYGINGSVDNNKYEIKFLDEISYKNNIYFCKFRQDEIEAIDKLVQRYEDNIDEFQYAFNISPEKLAITIFNNISDLNNKIKTDKITHNSKLLVKSDAVRFQNQVERIEEYTNWGRINNVYVHCVRLAKQKNDLDIHIPIHCVKILYSLDNRVTNAEAANILTKLLLPTMQMRTNFENNRSFNSIELHQMHNYQREIYAR